MYVFIYFFLTTIKKKVNQIAITPRQRHQKLDGIKPQVHGSTDVVIKEYRSDMEL